MHVQVHPAAQTCMHNVENAIHAGLEESTVRFAKPMRHLMFWDQVNSRCKAHFGCPLLPQPTEHINQAACGRMFGKPRQT